MTNTIWAQPTHIIGISIIVLFAIFIFSHSQIENGKLNESNATKESYENGTTPISLVFKDIIMIDKSRDSIEYDIKPKFNIRLNQDKPVQYVACADAQCSNANSFEITTTKDHEILFSSNQISKASQTNQFFQLQHATTEHFDPFNQYDIPSTDYWVLPIEISIDENIPLNQITSIRDIINFSSNNSNTMNIKFQADPEIVANYTLSLCSVTRATNCRTFQWQILKSTPEISIPVGDHSKFTIRITKNKPQ